MAIKIQGTEVHKSGGGGLGKLLGKVLGGSIGFVASGFNPAGAMAGASIGGGLGGAAGNAIKKEENTDLAIPVAGAKESIVGANAAPKTSAIDRLNSVLDLGQSVYGGVSGINNLAKAAPSALPGATIGSVGMNRVPTNAIQRRVMGV